MKVVFIRQANFLPQAQRQSYYKLFTPQWIEQRLYTLGQALQAANIPFIIADDLLSALEDDCPQILFNQSEAKNLYTKKIDEQYIEQAKYFMQLYSVLGNAAGKDWQESSFVSDYSEQDNSNYRAIQATVSKNLGYLNDIKHLSTLNSQVQEAKQEAKAKQVLDNSYLDLFTLQQKEILTANTLDYLQNLDLRTRKDEWVLFLDESAILHPDFMRRLSYFTKLRITPEVIDLCEPSHEEQYTNLALTLAQNSPELESEQETASANQVLNNNENATDSFILEPTKLDLGVSKKQCNSLFNNNYRPQFIYKPAYARYNDKLNSYFFVKRYESSFATSAFLIRVSTMQKIASHKTISHLANNLFSLAAGTTSTDVAYIRGPWAMGVNLPLNLVDFKLTNPLVKIFSYWSRGLGCYVRQLRLTASLDNNNMDHL
ncbi:hypothetical protein [Psittacicella hinzii]|uniref:Uncharacterized protein n=1 Tax=Psittacicella hinzii TaxID=2028575 RepID=A0A3A1YEY6_9GAMM|nr:hypothetical protein [Psittacicella hinzii]RIY36235.1 hypothetical protein CKF58_06045 [Psittacicella hinzii]